MKTRKFRVRPADTEIEKTMFNNLNLINKYNNRIDEINDSKNKVVAKSLRFRNHELSYIKPFLKDNNLSVGALVKFLFYQAGVWDDLSIFVMDKKGMDTSFTTIDPSKLICTKVAADKLSEEDHERLYKADNKGEAPSMNIHRFQADTMDQFLGANNIHFNKFVKEELFKFKILPPNLQPTLDNAMKSKRTKKNRDEVTEKVKTNRPLTLTTSPFERDFINNFIFFATTKQEFNTLSIAKVIKIMLNEQGYMGEMERFNTKDLRKTLNQIRKEFDGSYNYMEGEPYKELTKEQYEKIYKKGKPGSANLSIAFSNQDANSLTKAYTNEGFKAITPFVRKHVFQELSIYPNDIVLNVIENPPYKKRGRKKE